MTNSRFEADKSGARRGGRQNPRRAHAIRMHALNMVYPAQLGHPGGDLSVADILATLYFGVLRVDRKRPRARSRPADPQQGPQRAARSRNTSESRLRPMNGSRDLRGTRGRCSTATPTATTSPGVEANTGPLGHGLPVAVGVAFAEKLDKADSRAFVVPATASSGGQNWEAAMSAGNHRLDNSTLIVDRNTAAAGRGDHEANDLEPLGDKFRAFNWEVVDADGRPRRPGRRALADGRRVKPHCVIANTIKGKGVSFMEGNIAWFHGFGAQGPVRAGAEGAEPDMSAARTASPRPVRLPRRLRGGALIASVAEGETSASSSSSTTASAPPSSSNSASAAGSHHHVGIAEQNMVGVASGLANAGKIPFVSAASCFLNGARARADQGLCRLHERECEARGTIAWRRLRRTRAHASFDRGPRVAPRLAQSRGGLARRSVGDGGGGEGGCAARRAGVSAHQPLRRAATGAPRRRDIRRRQGGNLARRRRCRNYRQRRHGRARARGGRRARRQGRRRARRQHGVDRAARRRGDPRRRRSRRDRHGRGAFDPRRPRRRGGGIRRRLPAVPGAHRRLSRIHADRLGDRVSVRDLWPDRGRQLRAPREEAIALRRRP